MSFGGTINALNNLGTISNGNIGILNRGAITTLTNSGTILAGNEYFLMDGSSWTDFGIPKGQEFINEGYVVVAADYQGLRGGGKHQYAVAGTNGRDVIDFARTASCYENFFKKFKSSRPTIYNHLDFSSQCTFLVMHQLIF